MTLWWLSFCDDELPEGTQFLGATVAPGLDIAEAARAAWKNGTNPGGQTLGIPVPEHMRHHYEPLVGKLMSRAECEAFDEALQQKLKEGPCSTN